MNRIKQILKLLIPSGWLRAKLSDLSESSLIWMAGKRHRKALKMMKGKLEINIVYLATHSSTWKYDQLYARFENDQRFHQTIVVCPLIYNDDDYMMTEMESTFKFLYRKKFNVRKALIEETGTWLDIKATLQPDIIFFTNPWYLSRPEYVINNYLDYLTCYSPYGFYLSELSKKSYSTFFHSVLWRNFLETDIHLDIYKKAARRPENAVVTGSPGMDIFTDRDHVPKNVWKLSASGKKKIIWAPHHSIREEGGDFDFSSFLTYFDFMISIAEKYSDRIHIAFKPHPLLKNKLYAADVWGKKRTDLYYKQWDSMDNGQLCETGYFDLFLTSDGMVFDSISFIAEYLFMNKPSLFVMSGRNIDDNLNEFGKMAIEMHYHAFDENRILSFVENVILGGKDIKKGERRHFYEKYLVPPGAKSASENIHAEIVKIL